MCWSGRSAEPHIASGAAFISRCLERSRYVNAPPAPTIRDLNTHTAPEGAWWSNVLKLSSHGLWRDQGQDIICLKRAGSHFAGIEKSFTGVRCYLFAIRTTQEVVVVVVVVALNKLSSLIPLFAFSE